MKSWSCTDCKGKMSIIKKKKMVYVELLCKLRNTEMVKTDFQGITVHDGKSFHYFPQNATFEKPCLVICY